MSESLFDDEFGEIVLRRHVKSTRISVRLAPDGRLRASLPLHASIKNVKRLVDSSREELRSMINTTPDSIQYRDGARVGKSHRVVVRVVQKVTHKTRPAVVTIAGLQIIVSIDQSTNILDPVVQRSIRDVVIKALRIEATAYIPRRLKYLAEQHGFSYSRVRFSHTSSRWGSCSSSGTISINIAIMQLPDELISYILLHELSHTLHMNHSDSFWKLVNSLDDDYKNHRMKLRSYGVVI